MKIVKEKMIPMKKALFVNLLWIFLLLFHGLLNANDASDKDVEMENNYKKLFSPTFEERKSAVEYFHELRKDKLDEKYMKALIDLFKREAEQFKIFADYVQKGGTGDKLPKNIAYINSESYGMYHIYLCRLVSKSRDRSLLKLILKSCGEPEVLMNFGDEAAESLIDALASPGNPGGKITIIQALEEMLKPKEKGYMASGAIRKKIIQTMLQETKDSNRFVRSVSVKALGESDDKDVIPILEDISKNDPYHFEKMDESSKRMKTIYPVRESAKEALEKLKAKESEKK